MFIEVRSMKKALIIIVVVLALGVIGYGIFYVATHDFKDSKRESESTNVELNQNDIEAPDKDSVKLVETKEIDGSFVQKYNIVMNGQERILEVQFLNRNNKNIKEQSLTGEFSGVTLYAYYETYEKRDVYFTYASDSNEQDTYRIADSDSLLAERCVENAMNYITSKQVDYKLCRYSHDSNVPTDEIKSIIESIQEDRDNLILLRELMQLIVVDYFENSKEKDYIYELISNYHHHYL